MLSHPLALCRPSSVDYAAHTWPYLMFFEHRVGQNLALEGRAVGEHAWGYFPRMSDREAIVFLSFDSACEGEAVGVVRTAFDDPSISARADAPRRSATSVEVDESSGRWQSGRIR